jgi:(1->4)-alpha-D-glucan 1-alpha-D-glucosylmutase
LKLRRRGFFAPDDDYRPVLARGAKSAHVIAFARGERSVTVVPRLLLKLAGEWKDTTVELPEGSWRNVLAGEALEGGEVPLADLLKKFPVALLIREE